MTGLFLTGIGHLTTNEGTPVLDAVVAIDGSRIAYAGPAGDAPSQDDRQLVDLGGRAVIPGFVDAHSHVVFAGDRSHEFARRIAGESYEEIAAAGGGILSTVEATRTATEEQLFAEASSRVWRMIRGGTTTIEIKSGYGLDLDTEMRMLAVARRIGDELPVTVRTTFLGGHAVPPEFEEDPDGYVDFVIEESLPAAAALADYCDVFVERGAFDVRQARRILNAGLQLGLEGRVHAEQLSHLGGARLAAEVGARSADHLDHATSEDAKALAAAGVAPVLVPGASFSLAAVQAPAAIFRDAGCEIAIATDCNPGTSFIESMGFVVSLAVLQMGMDPEAAVRAATLGGARSMGFDDRGALVSGWRADLAVLDAPSPEHIPYRPGTDLAWGTINGGRWAHRSTNHRPIE